MSSKVNQYFKNKLKSLRNNMENTVGGGNDLSKTQKELYDKGSDEIANKYIKKITGVVASEKEMEYLKSMIPKLKN
jgi:hypothetical protein